MANVVDRRRQDCRCKHGCPTHAIITKYECGCVDVEIFNDSTRGSDCSNFSGMRRRCGKDGRP